MAGLRAPATPARMLFLHMFGAAVMTLARNKLTKGEGCVASQGGKSRAVQQERSCGAAKNVRVHLPAEAWSLVNRWPVQGDLVVQPGNETAGWFLSQPPQSSFKGSLAERLHSSLTAPRHPSLGESFPPPTQSSSLTPHSSELPQSSLRAPRRPSTGCRPCAAAGRSGSPRRPAGSPARDSSQRGRLQQARGGGGEQNGGD